MIKLNTTKSNIKNDNKKCQSTSSNSAAPSTTSKAVTLNYIIKYLSTYSKNFKYINFRSLSIQGKRTKLTRSKLILITASSIGLISSLILYKNEIISSPNISSNLIKFKLAKRLNDPTLAYAIQKTKIFEETQNNIELKLKNKGANYIETKNIENLISLPRYQNAIMFIKYANLYPNKRNYQRVLDELNKLSEYKTNSSSGSNMNQLEELIRSKIIQNFDISLPKESTSNVESNINPFLNDGLAAYLGQLLNDDLMIQLAFKTPNVDNRFFRREPPSTIQKLNKILPSRNTKQTNKNKSIYEDVDYGLIFEFYNNFIKEFNANEKELKLKATKENKSLLKRFYSNKDIQNFISKLNSEVSSLIVTEYLITDRPKINVWSADTDILLDELEDESLDQLMNEIESEYLGYDDDEPVNQNEIESQKEMSQEDIKAIKNLKQKSKYEFVGRNESLILNLLDTMVKVDPNEFVKLNGMETLLLLYEKHKFNENYLNKIGNCLTLVSLDPNNQKLFIQSGWLKRLNQMCNSNYNNKITKFKKLKDNISLIRELIAHKVLFNLNNASDKYGKDDLYDTDNLDDYLFYSTMMYPLYPTYSASLQQKSHLLEYDKSKNTSESHQHVIDVIYIHGLRGSLFKTWRQNESENIIKDEKLKTSRLDHPKYLNKVISSFGLNDDKNNIIDKINDLIDSHLISRNKFTYCYPKDWLPYDLTEINQKNEDKFRVMGVNYDTMYSLWGEDLIDDKKLKWSIKQRAIDLIEQLKMAHVGKRPVVWICHSMGGLIVKQIMVQLNEMISKGGPDIEYLKNLLENNRAIVFLSTPHLGSSIAKTTSKFSFATYASTDIHEMATDSDYLVDLNKKFLNLVKSSSPLKENLKVISLLEKLQTPIGYISGIYITTVTEKSAKIDIGEFHLINDKDHLNICKPNDRNDFMYMKIINLINDLINVENLNCEKCKYDYYLDNDKKLNEYLFEFFRANNFY